MWRPCWAPRQKFPPPTTKASSTPVALAAAFSRAREAVASGETPKPPGPARNSPDSFSSARRGAEAAASLADRDAGEAADLDVLAQGRDGLLDELADGPLVVLDVRLVEQDDLGVELVQAALDDLVDDVLGLALLERLLAQGVALGRDPVLGDVLATHVLRVRHRHVHGEVLRQLAERLVAGHEVGLAVQLHQYGELAVVVDVRADEALLGHPVGLLVGLGDAALAQELGGLIEVAARVLERALDVHHAGVGHRPQLLDHLGRHGHRVTSPSFRVIRLPGRPTGVRSLRGRGPSLLGGPASEDLLSPRPARPLPRRSPRRRRPARPPGWRARGPRARSAASRPRRPPPDSAPRARTRRRAPRRSGRPGAP